MSKLFYSFLIFGVFGGMIVVGQVEAAELHNDLQGTWKAEVVDILDEDRQKLMGVDAMVDTQDLVVRILEGKKQGELVEVVNDFFPLEIGDRFFLDYILTVDGQEFYSVAEPDRLKTLLFFVGLFALVVIAFSGWQGVRALLSLVGSFLVIFYFLLPNLLAGWSPLLLSIIVSIVILTLVIYFTHGFHLESTAALLGTVITISGTAGLAVWAVSATKLSGFAADESVFLNISTAGNLNFQGLLLGAIIIGTIGILDDIAITQAATVNELHDSAPQLTRWEVYYRALRVGREHVASLVNTLVFAYTGAVLPLLLLFTLSDSATIMIINREIFATEIIRTVVGSIGLILTVPVTTAIAVFLLYNAPLSRRGK
ncbi:MAG: YibE/F family protein [Patescibacteria group bacterium]